MCGKIMYFFYIEIPSAFEIKSTLRYNSLKCN